MDLLGIAAVIAAASGFVVAATGMVVAFRVSSPLWVTRGPVKLQSADPKRLPPDSPQPGESVALGTGDLLISHGKSTRGVIAGGKAWLERLF